MQAAGITEGFGGLEIVRLLLESGADLAAIDSEGKSALDYANAAASESNNYWVPRVAEFLEAACRRRRLEP